MGIKFEELPNLSKTIIIFGAGVYGKKCLERLKAKDICADYFFLDNNTEKEGLDINGVRVYSFDSISQAVLTEAVIIIAKLVPWESMYLDLNNRGLEDRVYVYSGMELLEKVTKENYKLLNCKKRVSNNVLWFDYHVVEQCNLNCAGCIHFSCIAKEEYADVQMYRRNLEQIKKLLGKRAASVILLGGEPLLHPDLCSFFRATKEIMPWMQISLVTNGILLERMREDFWDALYENGVLIAVTKYPIKFQYESLFRIIENKIINYVINEEKGNKWMKLALNEGGNGDIQENYCNCSMANKCITLTKEGRLFTCPVPAHFHHFKDIFDTNIDYCSDDYIDIFTENDGDNVLSKLATPIPFCRFCKSGTLEKSEWKVTNKEKNEWMQ